MILLLLLLLFILKFNYPEPYLDYLIGAVLLLCVFSVGFTVYQRFRLDLKVEAEEKTFWEGQSVDVSVEVLAPAVHTLLQPVLSVKCLQTGEEEIRRPRMDGDRTTFTLEDLKPGTLEIRVKRILIPGLFRVFRLPYKTSFRKRINVFPKEAPLNRNLVKKTYVKGDGEMQNAPGEDYTEIYEIRPMQEGDSLRHVHRQLSAKYDEYMIKVGSDSRRTLYIFQLKTDDTFREALNLLGQVLTLRAVMSQEEGSEAAVRYRGSLRSIRTDGELYALMEEIYERFL